MVPFIILQVTDNPDELVAHRAKMTAPWFAAFGESSFYIIIEGIILCETSTFVKGLCLWFASHYVFNLEYSKSLKEVCLSSRICVQASSRIKKTARYLMTSSNIVCD